MIKNLIYIDEERRARDLLSRRLQSCVGEEVTVIPVEPDKDLDEMIGSIEKYDNLVSVIIDQRLNVAGTTNYLGTDLVSRLRLVDKVIPIYILTNHVDDINQGLGSIEYVLNKDDLDSQEKLSSIGERIKRHINIFHHILNENESRFEELLRKRFESSLNEAEINEFSSLKYYRERKLLASTFLDGDELTVKLQQAESKLNDLERMIKR